MLEYMKIKDHETQLGLCDYFEKRKVYDSHINSATYRQIKLWLTILKTDVREAVPKHVSAD